jgi:catechol 2,3-dioxygenase-like lactoylglutathione lyase family enzyme
MARVQLALDVTDLEASVTFYSALFGVGPAKRKPGYANFEISDPPLKLVLFESAVGGTLNHLGVETDGASEVEAADDRLRGDGLETSGVDDAICCYAEKVETWVTDPDGARWEWYVKTADADEPGPGSGVGEATVCCAAESEPVVIGRDRDEPAARA